MLGAQIMKASILDIAARHNLSPPINKAKAKILTDTIIWLLASIVTSNASTRRGRFRRKGLVERVNAHGRGLVYHCKLAFFII